MRTYVYILLLIIFSFVLNESTDESEDSFIDVGNLTDPFMPDFENLQPEDDNPTIISLVDFSNFKHEIDTGLIILIVYFQRLQGRRKKVPHHLKFSLNYKFKSQLRFLQEGQATAYCVRNSSTDGVDLYPFQCGAQIPKGKEIENLETNSNSFDFTDGDVEPIFNDYALEAMDNLQDKDKRLGQSAKLYDSVYNLNNDGSFSLKGELDNDDFPKDKSVELVLKDQSDNAKKISCKLTGPQNKVYYTLNCPKPTFSIKEGTNITGTTGRTSDNDLLTIVTKDKEDKYQRTPSSANNDYSRQKSSSGGLSGGAIAGIVIACTVAFIAAAVTAVLCRAPVKPPLQEESTLGINTNNMH